jgi:hypothetical protein
MVSVSKKKLRSSDVTLDAPVLVIKNSPRAKETAIWMDEEWLPNLIEQIQKTKAKVKSLRYHENKITIRFTSPKDATMFRLTYEHRFKKKIL